MDDSSTAITLTMACAGSQQYTVWRKQDDKWRSVAATRCPGPVSDDMFDRWELDDEWTVSGPLLDTPEKDCTSFTDGMVYAWLEGKPMPWENIPSIMRGRITVVTRDPSEIKKYVRNLTLQ